MAFSSWWAWNNTSKFLTQYGDTWGYIGVRQASIKVVVENIGLWNTTPKNREKGNCSWPSKDSSKKVKINVKCKVNRKADK